MLVPWLFVLFAVARGDQVSGTVDDVHTALITEAAVLPAGLLKRDVATCAFVSGDPASPLTCPSGQSCISTYGSFACCNEIDCPGNWRTCADFGASLCGYTYAESYCSSRYTSILACSSGNPYCFRYALSSSLSDYRTLYSYACGPSRTPSLVRALARTTGEAGDGSGASTTTGPKQVGSTSTGETPSNSTSPLSLRAIIALAVLGIVILAAIISTSFWLWKRHKRREAEIQSPGRRVGIPYARSEYPESHRFSNINEPSRQGYGRN